MAPQSPHKKINVNNKIFTFYDIITTIKYTKWFLLKIKDILMMKAY